MYLRHKIKQYAFTLAEMAVVVVIMSIMMTAGVKILLADLNAEAEKVTKQKQERIKQALIDYLGKNKRLPCPDTGAGSGNVSYTSVTPSAPFDGLENLIVAGGNCANYGVSSGIPLVLGIVPYRTLGLSQEDVIDGWQNYFLYRPDDTTYLAARIWTISSSPDFTDTDSSGSIVLRLRNSNGTYNADYARGIAAIISHGKNGKGAFTTKGTRNVVPVSSTNIDEWDNAVDGGVGFTVADHTEAAATCVGGSAACGGGPYDDIVASLTEDEALSTLRQQGVIKNMQSETQSQLRETQSQLQIIEKAVQGYLHGGACRTPTELELKDLVTVAQMIDPWGTAIVYSSAYTSAFPATGGSATAPAYQIVSYGPDKVSGGVDDISIIASVAQLRGILGSAYASPSRCP